MKINFKSTNYVIERALVIKNLLNKTYNINKLDIRNIILNDETLKQKNKYNFCFDTIIDILAISYGYKNFQDLEETHIRDKNNIRLTDNDFIILYDYNNNLTEEEQNKSIFISISNIFREKMINYLIMNDINEENANILSQALTNELFKDNFQLTNKSFHAKDYLSIYSFIEDDYLNYTYYLNQIINNNEIDNYVIKYNDFFNFSYINIYIKKQHLIELKLKETNEITFSNKSISEIINNDLELKNKFYSDQSQNMWIGRCHFFIESYLNFIFFSNVNIKIDTKLIVDNFDLDNIIMLIKKYDPEYKTKLGGYFLCLPGFNKTDIKISHTVYQNHGYISIQFNELNSILKNIAIYQYPFIKRHKTLLINKILSNKFIKKINKIFKLKTKYTYYIQKENTILYDYWKDIFKINNIENYLYFYKNYDHFYKNYDKVYKNKKLSDTFYLIEDFNYNHK